MAITMEELRRKAEAYDEVLERAKEIVNNQNASLIWKDWLRNTFPELKESEDERIRKALIEYFNEQCDMSDWNGVYGYQVVAWLERQGGQKLVDKVEHKFNEGEWVILTAGELSTTLQIVKVDTYKRLYWFNDSSYLPIVDEECLQIWTIQDAKDGDVLAFDNIIVIFKDFYKKFAFHSYGYIEYEEFCISKDNISNCWEGKGFHPATKAQRDTLERAMTNAGWEFDFEKKELKKLSQQEVTKISDQEKDSAWNEEDEINFQGIMNEIKANKHEAPDYDIPIYYRYICWLESIKQRIGG